MSSFPSEGEIWSNLSDALKGAADDCELLARLPAQGPTYLRFVERLKIIDAQCRLMAMSRSDAGGVGAPLGFPGAHGLEAMQMGRADSAGWLETAHMVGAVQQKVGDWIRGRHARLLFSKMAQVLREMHRQVERRRTAATGHATMTRGALMPPVRPGPHRDTRPVQVRTPEGFARRSSGIYVPPGYSA